MANFRPRLQKGDEGKSFPPLPEIKARPQACEPLVDDICAAYPAHFYDQIVKPDCGQRCLEVQGDFGLLRSLDKAIAQYERRQALSDEAAEFEDKAQTRKSRF